MWCQNRLNDPNGHSTYYIIYKQNQQKFTTIKKLPQAAMAPKVSYPVGT